jgi:murein DD-endopeptidase MepM/ murein hydrolase activator NlpD
VLLSSQEYPTITDLSYRDENFAEYSRQVETAYKAVQRKRPATLHFYAYTAGEKDTVFSVASRCSIPYETLATLNGIRSADEILAGRTLYLAAAPGIFVPETAENPVETLVQRDNPEAWDVPTVGALHATPVQVGGRKFLWKGAARFSNEARFFFLDPGFALPLEEFRLTSPYGNREDPFAAAGRWQFHRGVDLAAPEGTPVKASKGGVIAEVGFNDVYGNYVIIRHAASMQSLYGHLSRTDVAQNDAVVQGRVIGAVGTTGQSTGPHLHFEIRTGENAKNPADLVKGIF